MHHSEGLFWRSHQQIKETPAINYNVVKRIITGCQDYNPPVRIIMDYTTVPVSRSLWNGNKIIYYLSKLHSFLSFVQNILPYQFRNPYGWYYKIIHYLSRLHSFFSSVRVVTKYTNLDRIVDHTEHYIQFYTLRAVCSDTRAVELGINRFV